MFPKKELDGFVRNSKYLIETEDGFVPFEGIAKVKTTGAYKITLANGVVVETSKTHRFIVNGKKRPVYRCKVGTKIEYMGELVHIVSIDSNDDPQTMFDIVHCHNKNHSYYGNGVNHSNCKFLGSSKTLINAECLEEMTLKIPPDPIAKMMDDKFKIWEKPVKGCTYILAVDVGKGVGGDHSIIQVLRIYGMHKAEQVAVFGDNFTPINDFAQIVVSIARYYNQSEIIVENNDLGGVLCERIFEQLGYDRLVSYEKDYFGVRSNKKNKAIGNIALREYIESNWVKLNDEETIKELSFYEEVRDNIFQAITGEHDDRAMSLLWALFWLKSNSEFEDENISQINPRYRIHDKEIGYEDTGMGDGDADWMGGGGSSGGDWLSDSPQRNQASMFGRTTDALFSGFGSDEDDLFGGVKAGSNSTQKTLLKPENGGYRHSNGALAFEDDIPSL